MVFERTGGVSCEFNRHLTVQCFHEDIGKICCYDPSKQAGFTRSPRSWSNPQSARDFYRKVTVIRTQVHCGVSKTDCKRIVVHSQNNE